MSRLRYMQQQQIMQANGLSQSFVHSKRKLNPWAHSMMGHRRCTGEPSYLRDFDA